MGSLFSADSTVESEVIHKEVFSNPQTDTSSGGNRSSQHGTRGFLPKEGVLDLRQVNQTGDGETTRCTGLATLNDSHQFQANCPIEPPPTERVPQKLPTESR